MADVDFGMLLARKYALLQQGANDASKQADTSALVGAASARLDNTRADLAPAESKSTIGLQGAQSRLLGEQASVVAPTAAAQNALTAAQTSGVGIDNRIKFREGLTPLPGTPQQTQFGGGALSRVMGGTGFYRLSDPLPAHTAAEAYGQRGYVNWLDRINNIGG